MALTDTKIKNLEPLAKDYKVSDGNALYLLVKKSGSKYWRMNYRWGGNQKTLSFGPYPKVGLKKARQRCSAAHEQLDNDIDPSKVKKARKAAKVESTNNSFEAIGREWLAKYSNSWASSHYKKQIHLLERNLFPFLGDHQIKEITPPMLLDVLRKCEKRKAFETARRSKQVSGQIFRYAIATGRADSDPSSVLKGALVPPRVQHFPAITDPNELGQLLRMIDQYSGTPSVSVALRLLPLVFVRPGELRNMEWSEVNFDKGIWEIPETKMKMKQPHIVPLSNQAVSLLAEIEPITAKGRYVFPNQRTLLRPMSDNALNAALRNLGIPKNKMTAHGFRATARTLLDEILGFPDHLTEHQLAHEVRDPLGKAYNRTKHLPQRAEMMQRWANYLDTLKSKTSK